MLNSINGSGLSKSKKVTMKKHPGPTSKDIAEYI